MPVLIVFLLALSLLPPRSAAAQRVRLRPALVEARAAFSAGQPEQAAALARRALDQDPTSVDAALLLGLSLEAQGRLPEAVAALAATARPLPAAARTALARLLPGAFPDELPPEQQAVLPGAGAAETVGATAFRVLTPEGTLPSPVADPKYHWSFTRRAAVYVGAARRYSVYYQDAADRGLAARIAELLGRLHGAAALLNPPVPRPAEVRVWLPRAGQAGGEQYRDSLYLFAAGVPRTDAEWVREVAHELGHLVLPSMSRFDAPEPMENGYLGERLLPKWLLDLGERVVWDGHVSLADYVRERAAPPRRRYLDAGPASPLRTDRGAAGMEYAIGMVLALEAQHGPAFLGRVVARNAGSGLESLLLAYREEVAALGAYRIPAELVVARQSVTSGMARGKLRFRRATYRAFLPSGPWRITARGDHLANTRVSLTGRRLSVAAGPGGELRGSITTDVSRWHTVQLETTAAGAALTEIVLTPVLSFADRAVAAARAGRNLPSAERR